MQNLAKAGMNTHSQQNIVSEVDLENGNLLLEKWEKLCFIFFCQLQILFLTLCLSYLTLDSGL